MNVAVPSLCLTTGLPRIFKTDHADSLTGHSKYRLVDVALATSAAPTYFPVVRIPSPTSGAAERFVDGGVCANNPALVALVEARHYLKCDADAVSILSVATPRVSLAESHTSRSRSRGYVRWAPVLADMCISPAMSLVHHAMGALVNQGHYARVELPSQPGLTLDNASTDATNALLAIGAHAASQVETRSRLKAFFAEAEHGFSTASV